MAAETEAPTFSMLTKRNSRHKEENRPPQADRTDDDIDPEAGVRIRLSQSLPDENRGQGGKDGTSERQSVWGECQWEIPLGTGCGPCMRSSFDAVRVSSWKLHASIF
jgi:hypothetical protein